MYLNVNNCKRLDFGETAKTTTRKRFLGAIAFLYRNDNVYMHARIQELSSGLAGGGGGGSKPE